MIGGGEDDIDELLEACGTVVDRPPARGPSSSQGGSQVCTSRVAAEPLPASTNQGGAANEHILSSISSVLQQSNQLMAMMMKKGDESKGEEDNTRKRKLKEDNHNPEEPIMLLEESYRLEDDAHQAIDFKLRQRLRPINVDPASYWVKGTFRQVDRPILGALLYTEHIMPGYINELTACKMSDRCAHLEIKNFLTKNSGVARESKKNLKVSGILTEDFSMGIGTDWTPADTVWEVVDAGFNLLCAEHMIRQYSYTGISMLRALHEIRYFCGVTSGNPKLQRTLLESFYNECLKVSLCSGHACIFIFLFDPGILRIFAF